MKAKLTVFFFLLTLLVFTGPIGCGTTAKLEQGGAYAPTTNIVSNGVTNTVSTAAPDIGLFVADQLFKTTYDTLTFIFDLERNNRDFFWSISHDIKHELDKVRPQAVSYKRTWAVARQAYQRNPTPAGLDQMNSILSQLQRLAISAQTALPKTYSIPAK